MSATLRQVGVIAARSIRRTLRQPALIVPSIVFPLFLLAVNASGLSRATDIPGFPTDSYLDFALVVTFMQGALFAAITAGTELANDIETGFFDRLALTPMRGLALLVGQLAGAATVALAGAVVYLVVGLIAGGRIAAGVGGAFVLIAYAVFIAVAFGAIGSFFALRTGSAEAVQGLFPLLFVTLFLSSSNLPRNLIETGWFRHVASWNPVSYVIEGMRSLVITGWDAHTLLVGLGVSAGIAVVAFAVAVRSLRTRLVRT
ncbi:MAG: type transport system permease protein [Microbacteriaceae bacterium]|nr:type transport system permease protein [Microbacteriaceae bacterium]